MPIVGPEALKQYVTAFRGAFPDLRFTIEDLIGEGDKVVWRFTARGTHNGQFLVFPPSGKVGNVSGTVTFHFAGGQVSEYWLPAVPPEFSTPVLSSE